MNSIASHQRGFTLIELLLYMGLLVLFLAVLSGVLLSALDIMDESTVVSDVSRDSQYIISRFYADMGAADSIAVPASLNTSSPTLSLSVAGETKTYAFSGAALTLTDATGSGQLNSIGTTVTGGSFRRLGNMLGKNTITMAFTLTSTTTTTMATRSAEFSATAGLR